jgi:hypothetical protein
MLDLIITFSEISLIQISIVRAFTQKSENKCPTSE